MPPHLRRAAPAGGSLTDAAHDHDPGASATRMDVMMARDDDVVVFGEDVGYFGGVFRVHRRACRRSTARRRVFDAPISEGGIVGTAVGMAAYGLRPVRRDPVRRLHLSRPTTRSSREAARLRYRSAGEFTVPMVIRMPYGGGIFGGQTHSQSPEALFTHCRGLKTVIPSNPYDAKGLLIAAIEDPRPGDLPRAQAALQRPVRRPSRPAGHALGQASSWARCPTAITRVPLGKAAVVREGAARDRAGLRHDGPCRAGRGRGDRHRRRDHRPAHAAAARHRDDRRIGAEDRPLRRSSTRRRAPPASAPSCRRWCRSTASTISKRRSSASPAGTRPIRTPRNGTISRARPASDARCSRRDGGLTWAST